MQDATAAVFHGPDKPFEFQTFPLPDLRAGEALVKIQAATLCGSDLHTIKGRRQEPVPCILGHEAIGQVLAVGSPAPTDIEARILQVGDTVAWSPIVSCNECDRCRKGFPQKCRSLFKYGHRCLTDQGNLAGNLATHIHLRAQSAIVRLPESADPRVFSPVSCATATVMAAARAAGPLAGKRVLIVGGGMLGLTACAVATAQGADTVAVADQNRQRLDLASNFGATERWEPAQAGSYHHSYDTILEMTGAAAAVEGCLELADIGATMVLVGSVLPTEVTWNAETLVRKCLTTVGVHNYVPHDLLAARDFLLQNQSRFPFAEMVEGSFSLHQLRSAVEFANQQRPFRVMLLP